MRANIRKLSVEIRVRALLSRNIGVFKANLAVQRNTTVMGEVFCLFFERYRLTFCKEGLSLTGLDLGRCQSSVPESRWGGVCGFWLFAVIPKRAQFRCLWAGGRVCAQ